MINTNGFITKYIKECGEICHIENQIIAIEEHLAPMYAEIDALHTKYDAHAKIDEQKKLQVKKRSCTYNKEFYYFRSIIDGLYNLLEEYGWEYQANLFEYLTKFEITTAFEKDFHDCYKEDIKDTIGMIFTLLFGHTEDKVYIALGDDCFSHIKMPIDLDIEEVLIDSQNLLRELQEADESKIEDKEYATYLILKEKFEGK